MSKEITQERIAEIALLAKHLRTDGKIVGAILCELLDALTASRAEVQRLREIEVSENVYGMLTAHGSDGTMLVCGEFASGREFREKCRAIPKGPTA